jgi:hypothetical protein
MAGIEMKVSGDKLILTIDLTAKGESSSDRQDLAGRLDARRPISTSRGASAGTRRSTRSRSSR